MGEAREGLVKLVYFLNMYVPEQFARNPKQRWLFMDNIYKALRTRPDFSQLILIEEGKHYVNPAKEQFLKEYLSGRYFRQRNLEEARKIYSPEN